MYFCTSKASIFALQKLIHLKTHAFAYAATLSAAPQHLALKKKNVCVSICTFVRVKQVQRLRAPLRSTSHSVLLLRQYSYFCTSKASKASAATLCAAQDDLAPSIKKKNCVSICTFVLVQQEDLARSNPAIAVRRQAEIDREYEAGAPDIRRMLCCCRLL